MGRGFGVPGCSGQNIYEMYNREPLPFRIYAANGELRGRTLYAEDAAPLLSLLGDGATLHHDDAPNDAPVWIESRDGYAADSYDTVAPFFSLQALSKKQNSNQMNADLKGALAQLNKSYKAFRHYDKPMSKEEVKAVLEYGIAMGYKTTAELKASEVDTVLGRLRGN